MGLQWSPDADRLVESMVFHLHTIYGTDPRWHHLVIRQVQRTCKKLLDKEKRLTGRDKASMRARLASHMHGNSARNPELDPGPSLTENLYPDTVMRLSQIDEPFRAHRLSEIKEESEEDAALFDSNLDTNVCFAPGKSAQDSGAPLEISELHPARSLSVPRDIDQDHANIRPNSPLPHFDRGNPPSTSAYPGPLLNQDRTKFYPVKGHFPITQPPPHLHAVQHPSDTPNGHSLRLLKPNSAPSVCSTLSKIWSHVPCRRSNTFSRPGNPPAFIPSTGTVRTGFFQPPSQTPHTSRQQSPTALQLPLPQSPPRPAPPPQNREKAFKPPSQGDLSLVHIDGQPVPIDPLLSHTSLFIPEPDSWYAITSLTQFPYALLQALLAFIKYCNDLRNDDPRGRANWHRPSPRYKHFCVACHMRRADYRQIVCFSEDCNLSNDSIGSCDEVGGPVACRYCIRQGLPCLKVEVIEEESDLDVAEREERRTGRFEGRLRVWVVPLPAGKRGSLQPDEVEFWLLPRGTG